MRIRWPFVRRSTHDEVCKNLQALASERDQVVQYRSWLEDEYRRLAFLHSEADNCRIDAGAELSRLRLHFDDTCKAKDEAYTWLAYERNSLRSALAFAESVASSRLERLLSYGDVAPIDWAYPLPCELSTVVTADIWGVRGDIGGMAEDPESDDPTRNMALPMGLSAC